eukprot:6211902-Pleurochrysis_carterae.AAC.3
MCTNPGGNTRGFSREAESVLCDTTVPVDAAWRRRLEGRGTLFRTGCAHAFAAARAHKRAVSLLQHAVSRAVSKMTIVTATLAAMVVKNDAARVSSERLRRAAAATSTIKAQVAMASVHPTSAMVSATAETNTMAGAYMSNARRTLRALDAEACWKPVEVKAMKTVRSNMQHWCMCTRTNTAASTHNSKTIVARRASVRSGVV